MAIPVAGEIIAIDFAQDGTVLHIKVPDGTRWGRDVVEVRRLERMSEEELMRDLEKIGAAP